MISRRALIAVLAVVEVTIAGEMVLAVQGAGPGWSAPRTVAYTTSGSDLVEGGPVRRFDAGSHPALTVDIGYADLTIRTGDSARFDVSVSKSEAFGMFRATAPISARKDGDALRISAAPPRGWSMGDDRRVTVIVPPETRVTVVEAGDILAEGLRSEASISSTGRGSVTVDDYNAPALRVDANGRILLHDVVAPRLDATSSDSRIIGTGLQLRDGSIQSNDGRVALGFVAGADSRVTAETKNGSIRISGDAAASVPAARKTGGDDDDDDSSVRTVRIGAGDGRLDVHAENGSIDISARD